MAVFQGGQGCQSLWHVAIELGQALLLVVFICSRLHCNENRRVSPFSWPGLQALEMALQTYLEFLSQPHLQVCFSPSFTRHLALQAFLGPLNTPPATQPTSLRALGARHALGADWALRPHSQHPPVTRLTEPPSTALPQPAGGLRACTFLGTCPPLTLPSTHHYHRHFRPPF